MCNNAGATIDNIWRPLADVCSIRSRSIVFFFLDNIYGDN
jgi:hypothetical protein